MEDSAEESRPFKKLRVPKLHTEYGMKIGAKIFYESPWKDENDLVTWVESAPSVLPSSARIRFDSAGLQIYKLIEGEKTYNNVPSYKTSFIVIQSPLILENLRKALQDVDVVFGEKSLKLKAPFAPLYFAWDEIMTAQNNAQSNADQKEYLHMRVLCQFMKDELGDTFRRIGELKQEIRISHDLIWSLYPKKSYVFSDMSGYQQAYRITSCHLGGTTKEDVKGDWIIQCEFVQFNGYEYGFSEVSFKIPYFQNTKIITSLEVYPWSFLKDKKIWSELIARGRKVLDYQGSHYQNYNGIATMPASLQRPKGTMQLPPVDETPTWLRSKFNIVGRIIIDPYLYARLNEYLRRQIRPFRRKAKTPKAEGILYRNAGTANDRDGSPEREVKSQQARMGDLARPDTDHHARNRSEVEEDEERLFLMSPFLDGYSLGEKKWMNFLIEYVKPLALQDTAFKNLVLPQEQKDLILSFTEGQAGAGHELKDVISGKGEGLLMLLSGPPGTGKTLTAEAVADRVGRPLYHVDTHEIGTDVQKLSLNLRKIMNMAAEWNAIVLLDEADVFLQQRKPENILRNEAIAVFLRELEYYRGTLFLTTNMLENIDEAIESRVHIHIIFQRLQAAARQKIWRGFFKQVPQLCADLSETDYQELGSWAMNGRQIKNTAQMAAKWSSRHKKPLSLNSIEEIIRLTCPRSAKSDEDAAMVEVNGSYSGALNTSCTRVEKRKKRKLSASG